MGSSTGLSSSAFVADSARATAPKAKAEALCCRNFRRVTIFEPSFTEASFREILFEVRWILGTSGHTQSDRENGAKTRFAGHQVFVGFRRALLPASKASNCMAFTVSSHRT